MAKSIFIFFSFHIWTYYKEKECEKVSCDKCNTLQSQVRQYHMIRSYDDHGKVVHRPYSSCISSIENLTGTLLSSACQLNINFTSQARGLDENLV